MAGNLSPTMTVREFENGYWYVDRLLTNPGSGPAYNGMHLTYDQLYDSFLSP